MDNTPTEPPVRNNRVLVIDDNPAIHADIRKILCPPVSEDAKLLDALEAEVLGVPAPISRRVASFAVDSAHQGCEGLELVKRAIGCGNPYAIAFVDVRMPPGWDGVETTLQLWKAAPDLQIVICTAYSDYSWDELLARLGSSDQLVVLKKPFDTIEVLQLANALTEKWNLSRTAQAHASKLELHVRERTAALEEANAALQKEIAGRNTIEIDLKRAKDAAEAADRAKSVFLANMSHEIRTPLNGVIGMANLLLSTPLSDEQRDLTNSLSQCGGSLLTIITDILDFSKMEAGSLELETVDFNLAEHLEIALDIHAAAAERKAVELIMRIDRDVPARLHGDPLRLRQIVFNLLGNAIKFTNTGEVSIHVSLAGAAKGRSLLRFTITDTGIGVPPEVQKSLFQPFVQADSSTTRRFGGTGLGLAIAKRLAELMHGQIGVESSGSGGSTFWFTAELEAPHETLSLSPFVPSTLERHLALIVDDNETNRKLLVQLCAGWSLPNIAVEGARAALNKLRHAAKNGRPYDLVILDHHMAEIDGLGLAKLILADPSIPRPAMVLLTSRGSRLEPEGLRAHGLAACELKPIHPDKLRLTLSRALSGTPDTRAEPAAADTNVIPFAPPHQAQVPILVAEDNPVNQKLTLMQLRKLGYSADLVKNGLEAVEAVQRKPYALVLMDAQMPEMDGIAATRHIRAAQAAGDPDFPTTLRIVAMTANAMAGDREVYLDAGMDDYLSKPVRHDALGALLSRLLPPASGPVVKSAKRSRAK